MIVVTVQVFNRSVHVCVLSLCSGNLCPSFPPWRLPWFSHATHVSVEHCLSPEHSQCPIWWAVFAQRSFWFVIGRWVAEHYSHIQRTSKWQSALFHSSFFLGSCIEVESVLKVGLLKLLSVLLCFFLRLSALGTCLVLCLSLLSTALLWDS